MRTITAIGTNAFVQLTAAGLSCYALVHTFGWLSTIMIVGIGSITGALTAWALTED